MSDQIVQQAISIIIGSGAVVAQLLFSLLYPSLISFDSNISKQSHYFVGTGDFIKSNGKFLEECAEVVKSTCNKDTGGRKTLQSWSRGILFVVSAGGNIEYWQPLYRYIVDNVYLFKCMFIYIKCCMNLNV